MAVTGGRHKKKMQFSNDPMNLILTSRKEIRKKNQKGPSRYLPQEKFICEYVALWDSISERYDLQIDRKDKSTISKKIQTCRSEADRP
jgi:restriction endonuclease